MFESNKDLKIGTSQKETGLTKIVDWKPLGRLPSLKGRGPNGVTPSKKVLRLNRYLAVQESRIIKAV